ncbi:MAG TPA: 30S ribosome-binding factor RbfA [Candidatus Pacearchaeota archaeon]|nr:30S ribosome-binding factor RbfA [Candidatus Pacearchaeota archaeon]HOK94087.1 30S ribosome-binding factor RbfA [Candidatus Pacearchaeota archaeon]HPO75158.1 30S ribosome-binding factor RbfA [Candidatus Pacearchaeota archaeon]
MSSFRLQKLNSLLKKEISQILIKEIDFDNAFVSITDVDSTGDCSKATVFISVMPEEKEQKVLSILEKNIYDIQKQIDRKLRMKPVPKIHFEIDKGMKNFYKMNQFTNKRK